MNSPVVQSDNLATKNLTDLLNNIVNKTTAIEVRTVIVPEITYQDFSPWQAYQEIYSLTHQDSCYQQRQQLESEYLGLLCDQKSPLYQANIDSQNKLLPNPRDTVTCQKLLNNSIFLSKLRQINTIKQLKSENQTYAQTIIELEGKITNRYTEKILTHPQKELILELHNQGIAASPKQWQGIIGLIIKMIHFLRQ